MLKESRGCNYRKKLEEAIRKIRRRGYEQIKANIDPYETPKAINSTSTELSFVPDATAKKLGGKAYFEISKRGENPDQIASKWRLLSIMAKMKNGSFKIFVPHGSMSFTQRMINKHNIEAELIKI